MCYDISAGNKEGFLHLNLLQGSDIQLIYQDQFTS